LPTQVANLFVFAISGWKLLATSWQLVASLVVFYTFHLCSKLPICMSW